jgi:hypothetical protein
VREERRILMLNIMLVLCRKERRILMLNIMLVLCRKERRDKRREKR